MPRSLVRVGVTGAWTLALLAAARGLVSPVVDAVVDEEAEAVLRCGGLRRLLELLSVELMVDPSVDPSVELRVDPRVELRLVSVELVERSERALLGERDRVPTRPSFLREDEGVCGWCACCWCAYCCCCWLLPTLERREWSDGVRGRLGRVWYVCGCGECECACAAAPCRGLALLLLGRIEAKLDALRVEWRLPDADADADGGGSGTEPIVSLAPAP